MVEITAYENTDGSWREARLSNVLKNADAISLGLSCALVSLHDHKGALQAVWKDQESSEKYSHSLDVAWKQVGEASEFNTHDFYR